MPTSLRREDKSLARIFTSSWAQDVGWLLLVAALPLTVIGLSLVIPRELVLPAVAVIAIGTGFALEAGRLLSRARNRDTRLREYAAGLVFIGLAATILADTEGALLALGGLSSEGAAMNAGNR
jgi:hypothetical protein